MLPKTDFEKKLNVKIATSNIMDNAIKLWLDMYGNQPPWLGGKANVKCLNLPAAISEELARLVLTEFDFEISGSARADFIQKSLKNFLDNLSGTVELWCALGGIVIKPYAAGSGLNPDSIYLDVVQANRFYPTAFDSNKRVTGAIFLETKRIGDYMYTRLEHHNLEGTHYTVINKAFRSERLNMAYTEDDLIISATQPFLMEAIRQSAKEGSFVNYTSGARSRMDVAIRRSVLTGVNQTCGKLTEAYSAELGAEYYEVSAHSGARESHAFWQGRVYKIEGHAPGYPNFRDTTHYGDGNGLCGWNCRHSFYPYWPGISKPAYTKEKLDWYKAKRFEYNGEKLTDYECSQIQRAYERKIRESKRILASYDAAIKADPGSLTAKSLEDKFKAESAALKSIEAEMKVFCKQTNRKPDSKRTQVVAHMDGEGRIVNFGRSPSMKAVWANRKAMK